MKLEKDKHNKKYYLHFSEDSFVHTINDWEQIFGKWNWLELHVIHIYFEKDLMVEGFEFEFALLGLGFRFRHNY